jgi:predicted DNA-binding transcriptional regulator AlpA
MMTRDEICRLLKIHKSTLARLPGFPRPKRIGPRTLRWEPEEVVAWKASISMPAALPDTPLAKHEEIAGVLKMIIERTAGGSCRAASELGLRKTRLGQLLGGAAPTAAEIGIILTRHFELECQSTLLEG